MVVVGLREASIHSFCDIIDIELSANNNIISSINDFNRSRGDTEEFHIPFKVDRSKIGTKKDIEGNPLYLYKETQFDLSKGQVIDLLMGTKLYGDPAVAIRELLQNSIDACLLRQSLEQSWGTPYVPEINVKYHLVDGSKILEVIDNGTGMDQSVIDSYYSKVGSSFYKSTEFYDLKAQSNATFKPTSRFGIGILATFMVSDSIEVDTRRVYGPHKSSEPISLTIEGHESIFWTKPGCRELPGTSTTLFLRESTDPWSRMTDKEFLNSVSSLIPNPQFKITIESDSDVVTKDQNSFKKITSDSLKDKFDWKTHENIREINIELTNRFNGFVGSSVVAILESHGQPIKDLEMNSRDVEIEGGSYTLNRSIRTGSHEITEISDSISITDDGEIDQTDYHHYLRKSSSKVSLHGIDVSADLFPNYWNRPKSSVRLIWPFPLLIALDIFGDNDIDLNSARTEIQLNEKWLDLETRLAYEICCGIKSQVDSVYWQNLKEVLISSSPSKAFLESLNRI